MAVTEPLLELKLMDGADKLPAVNVRSPVLLEDKAIVACTVPLLALTVLPFNCTVPPQTL